MCVLSVVVRAWFRCCVFPLGAQRLLDHARARECMLLHSRLLSPCQAASVGGIGRRARVPEIEGGAIVDLSPPATAPGGVKPRDVYSNRKTAVRHLSKLTPALGTKFVGDFF